MDFLVRTMEWFTGLDELQASQLTTFLLIIGIIYFMYSWNRRHKSAKEDREATAEALRDERQANIEMSTQLVTLMQSQLVVHQTNTALMESNRDSSREMGKLIASLTEALTTFTRTVTDKMEGFGDSIRELESTIITHIEQEDRHHQEFVSHQSFNNDGLTGLRSEISSLTSQISILVNVINTQDTADNDVGVKVDNLANEVRLLTQAVEAQQTKSENESKTKETVS